jgi:Response regulators consisting of a CheY-like receiver domain and a winged-helix DNA-binding domain
VGRAVRADAPATNSAVSNGAVRVIIADDDPDIRSLVIIAVTRAQLELVDALGDGGSAWAAIREERPDLVVLDVSMPGITGVEISRLIRADDSLAHVQVLLLSAAVSEGEQQIGLDAGANEYVIKPFSPRELTERLTTYADGIRARA